VILAIETAYVEEKYKSKRTVKLYNCRQTSWQ